MTKLSASSAFLLRTARSAIGLRPVRLATAGWLLSVMVDCMTVDEALAEINALLGLSLRSEGPLSGGEQNGAHLLRTAEGRLMVLKLQPVAAKAERVLRAAPAVAYAAAGGWPVARWRWVGRLADGAAFVVQEHLVGQPVTHLDLQTVQTILAANQRQAGLAWTDAVDDSAQLQAVLDGDCTWKASVAGHTTAGADLISHGDDFVARAGAPAIPIDDVVHGDYSTSNMILTAHGEVAFVDCETIGKGSRVRDLADLHRQCFVHPGASTAAMSLIRAHACAVAGPQIFLTCTVAVSYNNLAWWVENKSKTEFDAACSRLHHLFNIVEQLVE